MSSRSRASLVAAALVAGLAGLTFTAGTARADTGASGDGTAEAGAHHGHHHGDAGDGGGHGRHHPGDLLHAALRLPDLTDAQRSQIHTLEQGKHAPHQALHQAQQVLDQAVAAQVDANKVDRSKLTAQLKAVSDAETVMRTTSAVALASLHGVLTPAQRTELADGVSAKIAEREQKHAAHEAKSADADAKSGGAGEHGGPWVRALGLSPAQETQIRANLKAAGATAPAHGAGGHEAQVLQELAAFKQASFTAPVATGGRPAGHVVDLAQAALPVLTDAQRTELSSLLRGSQPEDGN